MIAEIAGGLSGLKAAKDILQAMHGIKTATDLNQVKIELQGHILEGLQGLFAAQEAQAASSGRISELEQEIVRLKDWSAERERYHLAAVDRGAFAYMPKPGMEDGQPAHWLCANCFEQGHKSLLQNKGKAKEARECTYGCDRCRGTVSVHFLQEPTYPDQPAA